MIRSEPSLPFTEDPHFSLLGIMTNEVTDMFVVKSSHILSVPICQELSGSLKT